MQAFKAPACRRVRQLRFWSALPGNPYRPVFDRPTLNFHSNAQDSYLAVANAGSETTSLYQVSAVPVPDAVWLFGSALLGF